MRAALCLLAAWVFVLPGLLRGATYKGQNIDGREFAARAYSSGTHSYYYVKVVFDGGRARIYFEGGDFIDLSLNDSDIDDPHDVYCYDYSGHVNWHLNVDGLDDAFFCGRGLGPRG